ncbi:hypothetical protein HDV00_007512 [Rhizophlyctis rosea]|nr:hypothetical protein HDV00_007512 [Rhizophlyctis rosea]
MNGATTTPAPQHQTKEKGKGIMSKVASYVLFGTQTGSQYQADLNFNRTWAAASIKNETMIYQQPSGVKTFTVHLDTPGFYPSDRRIPLTGEIKLELTESIREFCNVYVMLRRMTGPHAQPEDMPETMVVVWENPEKVKAEQLCFPKVFGQPGGASLRFEIFAPENMDVERYSYLVKVGIGRVSKKGCYVLRKLEVARGGEGEPLPAYSEDAGQLVY